MSGFLLDTNVVSELIKPNPNAGLVRWVEAADEDLLYLSVLTLGEVRKGIMGLRAGTRRTKLEMWFESGLRARFSGRTLPVDEGVADRWGTIAAVSAAQGKPVPVIDGLLAATALEHNLTFVTRNTAHVTGTGVRVMNPWE